MLYLVYLRKTHKVEVLEALADDPVLERELEFDLRMFNKAEEEQQQQLQKKLGNFREAV
jgi:TusA-related sulfurtransferase